MKLDLNNGWKVRSISFEDPLDDMLRPDFLPVGWLEVSVPEEIHATLRKAGVIRGNTYNKTEKEEKWIEECDWVYYKAFFLPEEWRGADAVLTFQGLDTFAEIYINGQFAGAHQNMFRPCCLTAGHLLQPGRRNVLVVRFRSPVLFVQARDHQDIFSITTSDRIYARKAQMNYSWDFCGRCVTTGIWKPVFLATDDKQPAIADYYLRTVQASEKEAIVQAEAELQHLSAQRVYRLAASLTYGAKTYQAEEIITGESAAVRLRIPDPELWWPRPYGPQPLYHFELRLFESEKAIDKKEQDFGIRTLEVLREPQTDGISFQFSVNGRKLFMRGANWVPLNTVYTDITDQDYRDLVHFAVEGNLSMLRIWGGGIYENPLFYQLCDQHGILLWNDFMFSCGIYPHDAAFLEEVRQEAEYVIRQYRNYTCLAVWSADNEVGQSYIWAGREYEFDTDPINHTVLKNACAKLDPGRFYMITSPCSPDPAQRGGDNQESPYQGDMHLYIMSADKGLRANRDYGRDYYKRVLGYRPRFVSEFGFISLPDRDSYYRFNPRREPLRNPSEIIKFLPFTKELLEKNEIGKVIYYSQVFNASALKYWIEYFRSLKGTCAGTLYWKFNDPLADCPDAWMYPSQMSSVDMYHHTKMTYYYTRRAYADVLIAFVENLEGLLSVYVCNETLTSVSGTATVTRRTFGGKLMASVTFPCQAPADSAVCALQLEKQWAAACEDRFDEYLKVEWKAADTVYENRYFFADLNEMGQLKLPEGKITVSGSLQGQQLYLSLKADTYLRNVTFRLPDEQADYEDNQFDMDPGEERHIRVNIRSKKDLRDLALLIEAENLAGTLIPLYRLASDQSSSHDAPLSGTQNRE